MDIDSKKCKVQMLDVLSSVCLSRIAGLPPIPANYLHSCIYSGCIVSGYTKYHCFFKVIIHVYHVVLL